jgi:hypothetical protein
MLPGRSSCNAMHMKYENKIESLIIIREILLLHNFWWCPRALLAREMGYKRKQWNGNIDKFYFISLVAHHFEAKKHLKLISIDSHSFIHLFHSLSDLPRSDFSSFLLFHFIFRRKSIEIISIYIHFKSFIYFIRISLYFFLFYFYPSIRERLPHNAQFSSNRYTRTHLL